MSILHDQTIVEKICRILPRLGSNHDGEVIASARAIARTLSAAGFDWNDLAATLSRPALPPPPPCGPFAQNARRGAPHWRDLTPDDRCRWMEVLCGFPLVSEWESGFIASVDERLAGGAPELSVKQAAIIDRLILRAFNAGFQPSEGAS